MVGHIDRESDIAKVIDPTGGRLVIHIGPTFSRDIRANPPAKVQFIVDGRESNTSLIVLGYAGRVVADFTASG